ncbi:hypothetical protein D3C77_723370 [compost metagenome]
MAAGPQHQFYCLSVAAVEEIGIHRLQDVPAATDQFAVVNAVFGNWRDVAWDRLDAQGVDDAGEDRGLGILWIVHPEAPGFHPLGLIDRRVGPHRIL